MMHLKRLEHGEVWAELREVYREQKGALTTHRAEGMGGGLFQSQSIGGGTDWKNCGQGRRQPLLQISHFLILRCDVPSDLQCLNPIENWKITETGWYSPQKERPLLWGLITGQKMYKGKANRKTPVNVDKLI